MKFLKKILAIAITLGLLTPGFVIVHPNTAHAAGSFLGAGSAGHTNSSSSHSATVNIPSGTDLFVILAISTILNHAGNAAPNSATVAGSAATMISQTPSADQNTEWVTMFFYLSPPSGNQTVAVSGATGGTILDTGYIWAAYSGFAQSGQPDSSGKTDQLTTTGLQLKTTVVGTNCWVMGGYGSQDSASSITNGSLRQEVLQNDEAGLVDSNGTVAAGSYTITVNNNSQLMNGIAASFCESTATVVIKVPDIIWWDRRHK